MPWQTERGAGLPATSWRASDAARAAGADGMIYTSRRVPSRWHMVLFSWHTGPTSLTTAGPALPCPTSP